MTTAALGQPVELGDFGQRSVHAIVAEVIPQLGSFEQFDGSRALQSGKARLAWDPAATRHVVGEDPPAQSTPDPWSHGTMFVGSIARPTVRVESTEAYAQRAGMPNGIIDGSQFRADVRFAIPSDKAIRARLPAGRRRWPCASTAKPPAYRCSSSYSLPR